MRFNESKSKGDDDLSNGSVEDENSNDQSSGGGLNEYYRLSLSRFLRSYEFGITAAFGLLFTLIGIFAPKFWRISNLLRVARSFSFIAATGVGEAMVIITGGIDLSVGSLMGFAGILTAWLLHNGMSLWLAILIGLLSGAVAGLVSGVLVTKANMPPLIPTLGMLSIAYSAGLFITQGLPITSFGPQEDLFVALGSGFILGIPNPVVYMLLMVLFGWILLRKTPLGHAIYAIGGNEEACALTGISVDRIKMFAYAASGFIAAMSGILLTSRLSLGDASNGRGNELDVIAAVVIGGVSLAGGRGSVAGVLVGAAIMGVIRNAMVLLGISSFLQGIVIGFIIILAVLLDRVRLWLTSSE